MSPSGFADDTMARWMLSKGKGPGDYNFCEGELIAARQVQEGTMHHPFLLSLHL